MIENTVFTDPNPAITQAVLQAAEATHLVQLDARREDAWSKEDKTPVTIADLTSQAIILGALIQVAAEECVIAEEEALVYDDDERLIRISGLIHKVAGESFSLDELNHRIGHRGDPKHKRRWFVDPIDGTKGFLKGLAYAIGVARATDGELDQAWLAVPGGEELLPRTSGKLFMAAKGQGAWVRDLRPDAPWSRLQTSPDMPEEIRVVGSRAHGRGVGPDELKEAGLQASFLPLDSMAKYVAVATGEAHVYVREPHPKFGPNMVWDHAAGSLIVREAGGISTDLDGKAFDFTHGTRLVENNGVLTASCKPLHDKMLKLLEGCE